MQQVLCVVVRNIWLFVHSECSQFHVKIHKSQQMLHCSFNFINAVYKMDVMRK